MTLSLQHSASPWDRTLPKPSALLPDGSSEAYAQRNTSLLQHHMVGKQLMRATDSNVEEKGRRSTIACIPVTHILGEAVHHANGRGAAPTYLDSRDHPTRTRTSSVMSAEDTSRSSSPSSTIALDGSNSFCLCQREPKIPRPRNAFILYRQHHHSSAVAQHPGLPNPEISKIIGEQWRQLPDKAKDEWKALAEDEKVRHSQQYPDYRYKPRRAGRLGVLTSVSGPSSASSELPTPCQKCGGKPVTALQTPYTSLTPGMANMPQMNARMPTAQHTISPPHSGQFRQYTDPYGRPIPPPPPSQHDPRFQYGPIQQRVPPVMEGPEPKKRRYNGDAGYPSTRAVYTEQAYQPSAHDRSISEMVLAGQFHRANIAPARTGYPMPIQQSRPSHQQHRRDPSLTLPPLKTPLSQQAPVSSAGGPQSQKSGVEAMIMSIPVLNKVKILSQIAPMLAAPGPASPPHNIRGAIIAVEGMNPNSVYNMTNTLAEQLERDGKFAVRIFGGPDPYATLAASNRASNGQGEGEHLNVACFLDLISQWHKISRELQEYITSRPRVGEESPEDTVMQELSYSAAPEFVANSSNDGEATPRPRSPVSAISPKTMIQTSELSLKSPDSNAGNTQRNDMTSPSHAQAQPKSHIPASAVAQAQAEAEVQVQSQAQAQQYPSTAAHDRSTSSTPRPSTHQTQTQPHPSTTCTINSHLPLTTSSYQPSPSAIPIALVPHYQLTTVDISSIAMPITDAYSPHSHWQWLATLWRGCIGPDVTVIIQGGEIVDGADVSSAGGVGAENNSVNNNSNPNGIANGSTGRTASQAFNNGVGSHNNNHNHNQSHTHHTSIYTQPHTHTHTHTHNQGQRPSISTATQGPQHPPPQPPAPQPSQQQDVEVRLLDCRAVIVRAGPNSSSTSGRESHTSGSSVTSGTSTTWEGSEWWEKAKRRVGFEVEEFLRR